MKRKLSILIGLCCVTAITCVSVSAQKKVSGKTRAVKPATSSFNSISRAEIEMLLADVAKSNPAILKSLKDDPEMKKQQIENLKQLLAFASQAQRDGLASEPTNRQELDSIRAEVLAVKYDREINKDKEKMPAFGFITDEQVTAYWTPSGRAGAALTRAREGEFDKFFNAKVELLKAGDPEMKDREITEDERTQARDIFARIRIYLAEYEEKAKVGKLTKEFIAKANLQVKLQQAQFLARLYSEKMADKTKATDAEIAKYLAEHPELDTTAKKAKAEQILIRARAGEDFAGLANEFSEDPGNRNPTGEPQGGLYKDVSVGTMVASFERAALALEPGQVAPKVVESDFGYHIIKLEKKGLGTGSAGQPTQIYDVRHILIATTHEDPSGTDRPDLPLKDYVRSMVETRKEKQLIDKIVAENNIQVPDDFTVPGETPKPVKKAPAAKKRPVKKRG